MNAKEVFLTYAGNFDRNDGRIELKIVHTLAVADIMDRLTESLHLPEHLKSLAHICAMFHDIGRFEQVKQYGTFFDNISVDHAELGCEILVGENFLQELDAREQKMIITAIRNHNRFRIEDGLDDETLLLCKLIRDADKCDIFRVFACENMVDTMGETEEQVSQETVSEPVFQSIMKHQCVKREDRHTGLDIWVSFLAFFFDLYFAESIKLLSSDQYYRKPFDRTTFCLPETRQKVEQILTEVETYISRMTTSG